MVDSTMSANDALPELDGQLKQIYYAALEETRTVLLRKMGYKQIMKDKPVATHFIHCTKACILTKPNPIILRVRITKDWLDERRATETAGNKGCMCKALCKTIGYGLDDGKKYFIPTALSIYVNGVDNDSEYDDEEGYEEESSEAEEEVSELDKANAQYMAMVELLTTAVTYKQRDRATKGVYETNIKVAELKKQLNKRQKLMDKNYKKKK